MVLPARSLAAPMGSWAQSWQYATQSASLAYWALSPVHALVTAAQYSAQLGSGGGSPQIPPPSGAAAAQLSATAE